MKYSKYNFYRIHRPFFINYILAITLASTGKHKFSVHISFNNNAITSYFFKCRSFQAKHLEKKTSDALALLFREICTKKGCFSGGFERYCQNIVNKKGSIYAEKLYLLYFILLCLNRTTKSLKGKYLKSIPKELQDAQGVRGTSKLHATLATYYFWKFTM